MLQQLRLLQLLPFNGETYGSSSLHHLFADHQHPDKYLVGLRAHQAVDVVHRTGLCIGSADDRSSYRPGLGGVVPDISPAVREVQTRLQRAVGASAQCGFHPPAVRTILRLHRASVHVTNCIQKGPSGPLSYF